MPKHDNPAASSSSQKPNPHSDYFNGHYPSPVIEFLEKNASSWKRDDRPGAMPLSFEDQELVDQSLEKISNALSAALEATQAAIDDECLNFHFSNDERLNYIKTLARITNLIGSEITFTLGNYTGSQFRIWSTLADDSEIGKDYRIWVEPDRITIRMPALPVRYAGNDDPYNQILAAKLLEIPNFPQWQSWHASFIHVYPVKNQGYVLRDVDNYDYKKTIDVIACAMHTSDCATRFDMSTTTTFSDEYARGVYIEVTPKNPEKLVFPTPAAKTSKSQS